MWGRRQGYFWGVGKVGRGEVPSWISCQVTWNISAPLSVGFPSIKQANSLPALTLGGRLPGAGGRTEVSAVQKTAVESEFEFHFQLCDLRQLVAPFGASAPHL